MFKLPDNIDYRIFDREFKDVALRFVPRDMGATLEEAKKSRIAIAKAMEADEIIMLDQKHTNLVYYGEKSTIIGAEPQMDACYTDKPGVLLCIQTADCVPVLISDIEGKVIGAAHCGWKSAKTDILSRLISNMETKGAEKFVAIICPSIQQESYEVSSDYYESFLDENLENAKFFIPSSKDNHMMFDLPAYVHEKLYMLGIDEILHIKDDTYSNPDKYPSYRRSCHDGETYKENILSTIMIKK